MALGPTATILAYDLYKVGYHVFDVGNVNIEFEWYFRNVTTKIIIEGKFVKEAKGGKINITKITDNTYDNQIIEKIKILKNKKRNIYLILLIKKK